MSYSQLFGELSVSLLFIVFVLSMIGVFSAGRSVLNRLQRISQTRPNSATPAPSDYSGSAPKDSAKASNQKRRPEHPDIWWIDDRGRQRKVWLTEDWARSGDTNAAVRWLSEGHLDTWISGGRKHPADYLRRDLEFILSERFYNSQIYDAILRSAPILEFEEYAYFTRISQSRVERSEGELLGIRGYHTVWPAAATALFEAMRNANERDCHLHWDLKFRDRVPVFSSNSCPIG